MHPHVLASELDSIATAVFLYAGHQWDVNLLMWNKIKIIDQTMTLEFIAQSIVHAPDFYGTSSRMAMITVSVSRTESVITDLNIRQLYSRFHNNCGELFWLISQSIIRFKVGSTFRLYWVRFQYLGDAQQVRPTLPFTKLKYMCINHYIMWLVGWLHAKGFF